MQKEKIVEVNGLNKSYGTKSVLSNISFSVSEGEIVALIGNNAAGKTTLLDIMNGFRKYDEGEIKIFGLNPDSHSARIKNSIGYLPQNLELPDYLTVGELVDLFSGLQGTDNKKFVISSLDLEKWVNVQYKNLSGGFKRRTCAACILCSDPKLVLMDEPTSGMDTMMSEEVWNIIRTMSEQGIAIIITTHSLADALSKSDKVMILEEGRCVYFGESDNISKNNYEVSVRPSSRIKKGKREIKNDMRKRTFSNVSEMSEYILSLNSDGISDDEITIRTLNGSILEHSE